MTRPQLGALGLPARDLLPNAFEIFEEGHQCFGRLDLCLEYGAVQPAGKHAFQRCGAGLCRHAFHVLNALHANRCSVNPHEQTGRRVGIEGELGAWPGAQLVAPELVGVVLAVQCDALFHAGQE